MHRAHVLLRHDHICGRAAQVDGDLLHRTIEDALQHEHEQQRGGDATDRERGAAPILEQGAPGERHPAGHVSLR